MRDGKTIEGKFERKNKFNEKVWLKATYIQILDENHKPVKIIKLAHNITNEKENNLKLQSYIKKYQDQELELKQMLEKLNSSNQNHFQQLNYNNMLVDVLGRNRMLSQKIAFNCLLFSKGKLEYKKELLSSIELHDQSLQTILVGGKLKLID